VSLFLLSLPWILVTLYLRLFFSHPAPLTEVDPTPDMGAPGGNGEENDGRERVFPFVSVIVPARNEETNIGLCVESLLASDYPRFEVIVVDDRSLDGTVEAVQVAAGGAGGGGGGAVKLVRGAPLPEGWFGKPWACWQGAGEARGDLLLFTDADTRHAPDLLRRSVTALDEEEADVLTLVGRQGMETFWERLLQPQFFLLLAARYPRVGIPKKVHQWKNAIANGQFILIRLEAYRGSGGHEAVAGEVVEDLRLAQLFVRDGRILIVKEAAGLYTRMYRSLGGLVEGWSKNIATAALQTTPRWMGPIILPLSAAVSGTMWLAPPAGLTWALLAGSTGLLFQWALLATGLSLYVWAGTTDKLGGSPLYGLLYPLGAAVALYIFLKSWFRGSRIHWKGREYEMSGALRIGPSTSDRGKGG